jgi:hypothetical protein
MLTYKKYTILCSLDSSFLLYLLLSIYFEELLLFFLDKGLRYLYYLFKI